MKKLFKNSKQKPTVTPTPLALPPDTPVYAQRSRTAPPQQSYEVGPKPPEKWVFIEDEPPVTPSKLQKPRPTSTSLPLGASQPQSQAILLPIAASAPSVPSPPLQVSAQPHTKKKSAQAFPWPDYRMRQHVETSVESLSAPSNPSPDTKEPREKESALDVLGNFLFGARDVSRPSSERDHDKDRQREVRFVEPPDIAQMIGRLTATASEDWTVVLELCEYASANETAAKEAARALRREFKYADPSAQLSAARLWAIMLQNCSEEFIEQSASRKSLDAVEDVITSNKTNPVVRERLLEVLGSAVYHHTKNDRRHPFAVLWRKVKPPSAPEQGRPIDPSDSMYTPPVHNAPQQTLPPPTQIQHTPTPPVQIQQLVTPPDAIPTRAVARSASDLPPELSPMQPSPKKTHHNRIIPIEEDMRRIFSECEDAHNSARLLSDFLAFASPVDVEADVDGVVRELYTKCIASQERIVSQIPWATSIAEKSRDDVKNLIVPSPPVTNQPPRPSLVTKEEEMFAMLLAANQTLFESIRMHDESLRLAAAERVEKAVEERSKFDTRLDRSQMYVAADGSLYAPENEIVRSGSSRSPSPNPHLSNLTETAPASFYSPISQSSPPPHHHLQTDIGYPQNQYQNPAPVYSTLNGPWTNIPNELNQTSQNNPHNIDPSTQPRHAFHGPRTFISLSRTPSPELSPNQGHGTGLGLHGSTTTGAMAPGHPASLRPRSSDLQSESVRDRLERVNLSSHPQHGPLSSSIRLVPRAESDPVRTHSRYPACDDDPRDDDDGGDGKKEEVPSTPIVPSAKALGKRRAVEKAVDSDAFDPDDIFKEPRVATPLSSYQSSSDDEDSLRPKPKPTVYAYDAAAEREKERQALFARTRLADRGRGAAVTNGTHG